MDITCVVCGEPWDAYGVSHGDMLPWEAELFRKGAGCPCCEGESNGFEPGKLDHFSNGDGDPAERFNARDNHESGSVAWKRPADPVHWECAVCGVKAVTDLDTGELYYSGGSNNWYPSHPYHRSSPETEPHHAFGWGVVCEFCHRGCEDCCASLSPYSDELDTYDEGCAFPDPEDEYHGGYLCIDCYSERCEGCGRRDCDCYRCEGCGCHTWGQWDDPAELCPNCGHRLPQLWCSECGSWAPDGGCCDEE